MANPLQVAASATYIIYNTGCTAQSTPANAFTPASASPIGIVYNGNVVPNPHYRHPGVFTQGTANEGTPTTTV